MTQIQETKSAYPVVLAATFAVVVCFLSARLTPPTACARITNLASRSATIAACLPAGRRLSCPYVLHPTVIISV